MESTTDRWGPEWVTHSYRCLKCGQIWVAFKGNERAGGYVMKKEQQELIRCGKQTLSSFHRKSRQKEFGKVLEKIKK